MPQLNKKIKIAFRIDGHPQIGLGHVVRCLTMAQEFKKQHPAVDFLFIMGNFQPGISMVKNEGYPIRIDNKLKMKSIHNIFENIYDYKPEILILDINDTNLRDVKKAKTLGCFIVTIDDLGDGQKVSDLIIDANRSLSNRSSDKYLFGPDYIILREEFHKLRKKTKKNHPMAENILISFGGSDPNGLTLKVIDALNTIEGIDKTIIIGQGFCYRKELDKIIGSNNNGIKVKYNVENTAQLMKDADLAISTPGLTMYELACLGVPSLMLCSTEQQNKIANLFQEKGIVYNFGLTQEINKDVIREKALEYLSSQGLRSQLSEMAVDTVDGIGCKRVIKKILNLHKGDV